MSPNARHKAREYALQALYQWQVTRHTPKEIESDFLQHFVISKKYDLEYFKTLLQGTVLYQTELDQLMIPFLTRPLAELDLVELIVLRIAVYELTQQLEIPYRVVIDEALELVKKYGSIEGYKFINGVLDKIAHQTRSIEIMHVR